MFEKKKLFVRREFIVTSAFLLIVCLAANCARFSATKAIGVNQSNETNKKPMLTPKPANVNNSNETAAPTDLSKIPTVTYCDLIANHAAYDRKIVRVRAIYFSGFEKIYLYDDRCKTNQPPSAPENVPAETWARRDKSFVSKGDSAEAKLNRQLDGFGRKDVTVVGVFYSTSENGDANSPNRFGHMNCCRFQFSITRVESVVGFAGDAARIKSESKTFSSNISFK